MTTIRLHAILVLSASCALAACGGGGGDGGGGGADAPVPPTASDITCGQPHFQAEALRLINARRAQGASCGTKGAFPAAAAVSWNTALANAANAHSKDMADNNYFSHTSLDGRTFDQRISASLAWHTAGENIAAGQPSVQAVVDGWMDSDGHCANIMNASFKEIGLACSRNTSSTYKIYWTLDLGAR